MSKEEKFESAHQPAGGWGSVKAVTKILAQEKVLLQGGRVLMKQNKPDGFACVSCASAKPAHPHPAEFCSNGAQATAWEITSKRVDPGFFQRHTATELESWTDHALEAEGRLTAPLRWDAASDKYLEVTWKQAFDEIGAELKKLAPKSSVFYTSGRASLETAGQNSRAANRPVDPGRRRGVRRRIRLLIAGAPESAMKKAAPGIGAALSFRESGVNRY